MKRVSRPTQYRMIGDGTKKPPPRKPRPTLPDPGRVSKGWPMKYFWIFAAAVLVCLVYLIGTFAPDDQHVEPINQGPQRVKTVTETKVEKVTVYRMPTTCKNAVEKAELVSTDAAEAMDFGVPQTDIISRARVAILAEDFNQMADVETDQRKLSGKHTGTRQRLAEQKQLLSLYLKLCKEDLKK